MIKKKIVFTDKIHSR